MTEPNGHGKDLGYERDLRESKPCCERVGHSWCHLDQKHLGPHVATRQSEAQAAPDYSKGRSK